MQAQNNPTAKDDWVKSVAAKERELFPSEMRNCEEDAAKQNITARTQPFRVEARIDISSYNDLINAEVFRLVDILTWYLFWSIWL